MYLLQHAARHVLVHFVTSPWFPNRWIKLAQTHSSYTTAVSLIYTARSVLLEPISGNGPEPKACGEISSYFFQPQMCLR